MQWFLIVLGLQINGRYTTDQEEQTPLYPTLSREVQGCKQDYTIQTYSFLRLSGVSKNIELLTL
jgi:hypothetical protein